MRGLESCFPEGHIRGVVPVLGCGQQAFALEQHGAMPERPFWCHSCATSNRCHKRCHELRLHDTSYNEGNAIYLILLINSTKLQHVETPSLIAFH